MNDPICRLVLRRSHWEEVLAALDAVRALGCTASHCGLLDADQTESLCLVNEANRVLRAQLETLAEVMALSSGPVRKVVAS